MTNTNAFIRNHLVWVDRNGWLYANKHKRSHLKRLDFAESIVFKWRQLLFAYIHRKSLCSDRKRFPSVTRCRDCFYSSPRKNKRRHGWDLSRSPYNFILCQTDGVSPAQVLVLCKWLIHEVKISIAANWLHKLWLSTKAICRVCRIESLISYTNNYPPLICSKAWHL